MKQKDLTDLFVKLAYVFKVDLYIIDHKYVIGGANSEIKNIGNMYCELNEHSIEVIKELVSDSNFIYIKNIKDAKTDLQNNIITEILPTTKDGVLESLKELKKQKKKITNWGKLTLNEDEIDRLFNKNVSIEICKEETDTPVIISKNMFPMLTEKKLDDLQYALDTSGEYTDNLVSMFKTDFFTLYNVLYFLNY